MNSALLVSKIQRLLDTDGQCGDGAAIAGDYVAAVNRVNRRLNTCMTYLAEAQHSEAIRIAEESPAILDECATLSFVQFQAWQELCRESGWPTAESINEYSIEKLNAVYASASALEPLLKLYRKAVRSQDPMLVIRCLRRIITMDKGNQTWRQDLASFETRYLVALKEQFKQATAAQDKETLFRIAEEIETGGWIAPIDGTLLVGISDMRKADQKASWNVQFSENITLLHDAYVTKDFDKTQKYLANVQGMEKQGFVIPPPAKAVLEEMSEWCATLALEKAKETARRKLSVDLHKAIELADEHQIRSLLSSPEFLEISPDEDLTRRARITLQRFEFKRSQRRTQICSLIAFALVAVTAAGGFKYKQFLHTANRNALVQRLELAYSQENEEALQAIFQEIKTSDPKLYADGVVKIWEQKRSDLAQQTALKRQSFDHLSDELQSMADTRFANCDKDSVKSKLAEAKQVQPKNDLARGAKLAKIVASFFESCEAETKNAEQTAEKKLEPILSQSTEIQQQLQAEKLTDTLKNRVGQLKKSFADWQNSYSNQFPLQEVRCKSSAAALANAEQEAQSVFDQLKQIESAKTIEDWMSSRDTLVKYCASYPEVKPLMGLMKNPYKEAVDGTLSVFRLTTERAKKYEWAASNEKLEAVCTDIKEYADVDSQTKMYGIYTRGGTLKGSKVFSLKVPTIKPAAKGATGVEITGMLFLPNRNMDGFTDEKVPAAVSVDFALMPHCKYFNRLIEKASEPPETALAMVSFLLEESQKILGDAELTNVKRVQLLHVYYGYIATLANISVDPDFAELTKTLQRLGKPLPIAADSSISWLFTEQKDVQDREKECAAFLKQNDDFVDRIKKTLCIQAIAAAMASQQVTFVGSAKLEGNNLFVFAGARASCNSVFALRMEDDSFKLRHVLQVTGDTVALASKDTVLLPGEPLFAFSYKSQITSLPGEVKRVLREYQIPLSTVKHSLPPSWPVGLEVKE
jgi:hypothetical protein